MELLISAAPVDQFPDDPLAIPIFLDTRPPHREAGTVNFRLAGMLSRWIEEGTVDPASPTPTLFSPGQGRPFPMLVIAGAGNFEELSAPAAERIIAALTETLLKTKLPLFAVAARDFKRPLTPPRDSAEILLRGMAHGAVMAEIREGHAIRLHWDAREADLMVSELKRFRRHLPHTREWNVMRDPADLRLNL